MRLLRLVEDELAILQVDMALNASKSVCIRYGPRFDSDCSEISTNDGDCLRWDLQVSWRFSGRIEKIQNFFGQ